MLRKIYSLVAAFLLFYPSVSTAQSDVAIDEETKSIANRVILNIYYDILKEKDNFTELKEFGDNAFYQNKLDIYAILYKYESPPENPTKNIYEFGITISHLKDKIFDQEDGYFEYPFPALGVKFVGYLNKNLMKTYYDITKAINKYAYMLADHQQKYIPLQLSLIPTKGSFKVGEKIEFKVVLSNLSKSNLLVKSFGTNTLYFVFNNKSWGAQQVNTTGETIPGGKDVVLEPNQFLDMHFMGESFNTPREFEIFCLYKMAINGVEPYAKLEIKVESDSIQREKQSQ